MINIKILKSLKKKKQKPLNNNYNFNFILQKNKKNHKQPPWKEL